MKYAKLTLACGLLLIFSSLATKAQSYAANYTSQSLILRSDFPSKSVLVSYLSNKAGDMSPIIGAACWPDSGRQLECRSLLQFNYVFLPKMVIDNPSTITYAELVLYPIQVVFSKEDADKPSKFIIRRVTESWVDSTTMWMNQPATDSLKQVTKTVRLKKKNQPVSIDVTALVIDMLQSDNYGFMISKESTADKSIALGQLFASPQNDNENIRPVLIIQYGGKYNMPEVKQSLVTADDILREYNRKNPVPQSSAGTALPVSTTPVKIPIKD
jgi:hypothetical protein